MKRIFPVILLTAVLSPPFSAHAERAIAFTPPQLGAPTVRVGGGTRSMKDALAQAQLLATNQLQLLAANYTGLTSVATPTLYWYTASIPPYALEISVRLGENPPLLIKNIGAIKTAGIQRIRLADYGVTLVAGQNYTWSVALITNPAQRSADLLASATIRYQTPSTPLTDTAQMIEATYWYDAVTQLVETKSPQLQELLQQQGIAITLSK